MKVNWLKILANIGGTFLAGAVTGFAATGTWQGAAVVGVATTLGNQSGLQQTPPIVKALPPSNVQAQQPSVTK